MPYNISFVFELQRDGVPSDYDKYNPEHRQIYKFIRTLFNAAQLTAECAIITLVYLERYVRNIAIKTLLGMEIFTFQLSLGFSLIM